MTNPTREEVERAQKKNAESPNGSTLADYLCDVCLRLLDENERLEVRCKNSVARETDAQLTVSKIYRELQEVKNALGLTEKVRDSYRKDYENIVAQFHKRMEEHRV